MNLFEKVMIKIIHLLSSLFISIVLVLLSLWHPVTINNSTELKHVELGLPLSFFEQDLSRLDPTYPANLGVHSPLEYPFEIFWSSLIISILFVTLIFFVSPLLIKKLIHMVKRHLNKQIENQASLETEPLEESINPTEKLRERG